MDIVFVLLPLSLLLAGTALAAYCWCAKSGQFDDPDGDALRPLIDDDRV